jgi:hypothetical protein
VTHLVDHAVFALPDFVNDPIIPQLILFLRYHNKLKMDAFKSKPSLSDQLKSKHSLEKEQVRQVDEVEQYLLKNWNESINNILELVDVATNLIHREREVYKK